MTSFSMALLLHATVPTARLPPPPSSSKRHVPRRVQSQATLKISNQPIFRRSANYKPPIWSFEYIQSLKTEHVGESYATLIDKLKDNVRLMLGEKQAEEDPLHQLELIDTLKRLGLSYHFEDEINRVLEMVYSNNQGHYGLRRDSLYATALEFRLLRQHALNVPQEIFDSFRDKSGNFESCLSEDCKGMLYLYEASFLSMEGETILDAARTFAKKHLQEYVKLKRSKDLYLSILVNHALEFPLHWRMLRMEARWFIDIYQQSPNMNPILLDLAKLDFNQVQAMYQEDLKHASSWWKRTGLGENLGFIRDRLMENFLWTIGMLFQPQHVYFRRMTTQILALITTIDDVYDVYGTLDELELFTDAIERWDINAIEQLPDYMKLCFFSLYNSINGMAADAFIKQGMNILPYTKKVFLDLCKCCLLEAKRYHSGETPTLQEFFDIAVTSIGAPVALYHAYALVSSPITKEGLACFDLQGYPDIIQHSSMLVRLTNDLGTSQNEMKRGDIAKSIQCYMHETGASMDEATEYVHNLRDATWKKMNKCQLETPLLSRTFIEAAINIARMSEFMYMHGDGHSSQDHVMRNRIVSLLINPIA